jgi:hypothetical protein
MRIAVQCARQALRYTHLDFILRHDRGAEMSREDRSNDQRRDNRLPTKQSYEAPRLIEYGDIAAVTQAVGMTGNGDGGNGNMKATQP